MMIIFPHGSHRLPARMGKLMNEATRIRAPELPDDLDWFNVDRPLPLASQRGRYPTLELRLSGRCRRLSRILDRHSYPLAHFCLSVLSS